MSTQPYSLNLKNKVLHPYTLIYLVKGDQVLLLNRISSKKDLANKLLGLGGNIEEGESLIESAQREFQEETGLTLINPIFRGTFTWLKASASAGISHIFVAKDYTGELLDESNEGKLAWYDIDTLSENSNLADYQKKFLPKILRDDTFFYSAVSVFDGDKMIEYTDSEQHFVQRRK